MSTFIRGFRVKQDAPLRPQQRNNYVVVGEGVLVKEDTGRWITSRDLGTFLCRNPSEKPNIVQDAGNFNTLPLREAEFVHKVVSLESCKVLEEVLIREDSNALFCISHMVDHKNDVGMSVPYVDVEDSSGIIRGYGHPNVFTRAFHLDTALRHGNLGIEYECTFETSIKLYDRITRLIDAALIGDKLCELMFWPNIGIHYTTGRMDELGTLAFCATTVVFSLDLLTKRMIRSKLRYAESAKFDEKLHKLSEQRRALEATLDLFPKPLGKEGGLRYLHDKYDCFI